MKMIQLRHIPKSLLLFWVVIIAAIILVLIFTAINKRIVDNRVISTEMEFIAQMTFAEYERKGYQGLKFGEEKDIGPVDVPLYKEYNRTVKISEDQTSTDNLRFDLIISKDRYKQTFSKYILKNSSK